MLSIGVHIAAHEGGFRAGNEHVVCVIKRVSPATFALCFACPVEFFGGFVEGGSHEVNHYPGTFAHAHFSSVLTSVVPVDKVVSGNKFQVGEGFQHGVKIRFTLPPVIIVKVLSLKRIGIVIAEQQPKRIRAAFGRNLHHFIAQLSFARPVEPTTEQHL